MSQLYFVRMDSALTGETLAAAHFLGMDGNHARTIAHEQFARRLTEADVAGLSDDMAARILELDARSGENMKAGVTWHVRKSAASHRQASNAETFREGAAYVPVAA